jgi:hypothetical protein
MTRWQIFGLLLAGGLAVWLAWLYIAPHFDTRPEQDACSFGPVTNERYRELLAEARRRQASGRWSRLRGHGGDMNANLQFRLDDLMDGMDSIYERIAAVHAVMRALGANYRVTSPDAENAFAGASHSARNSEFNSPMFVYVINVHKIGGFAPILKSANIRVAFTADNSRNIKWSNQNNNTFYVRIHYPFSIYDGPGRIRRGRHNLNCPAVPGPQWVADYNEWLATLNTDRNN